MTAIPGRLPDAETIEVDGWIVGLLPLEGDVLRITFARADGLPVTDRGHFSYSHGHDRGTAFVQRDPNRDDNGRHLLPR